jgi:hypothetical protein
VDKDLEVDRLGDHQEEAEGCQEVGDQQEDSQYPCHQHHNQGDTMETNW